MLGECLFATNCECVFLPEVDRSGSPEIKAPALRFFCFHGRGTRDTMLGICHNQDGT